MSEKIDINTADLATLTTISGIGPALAERIIEYRETVHPFEEVIELAAVPGISEKMVRDFEELVTVKPDLGGTAVPLDLDEPEDTLLLDAPEEVILLEAPDQPEALLAAELPENGPETEDVLADEPAPAEPVDMEPVAEELAEAVEADEEETAVSRTEHPQIEDLPLAEPMDPMMTDPDIFAVAPTQPSAEWEAKAQRRGCLNTLLGATFGAILGAVLTLAVLAALNQGNLNFAASDSEIRQQLDTEIISRTNELNQLATRVSLAATEEATANQSLQSDFATANEAINEALSNNEAHIDDLATRSGDLEQRIEDVAGAADTFSDFLDGLRLLLDDLGDGTVTPTPAPAGETASPTPTPTSARTNTPTPSATTVPPTRTPQPTATPFTFPTNTPAPQP